MIAPLNRYNCIINKYFVFLYRKTIFYKMIEMESIQWR